MADQHLLLEAYLVVDNSMLVMLSEYCCERWGARMPPARLVPTICQWFTDQLDTLRQFAPDGLVHCTDCVAQEFNPRAGRLSQLRGIGHRECKSLADHVCSLLQQTTVDMRDVASLRHLPAAPRRLVGPGGLSDNDLSLVMLGAELTQYGGQVYLLTNDQDLLSFTSWLQAKPEVRNRWQTIKLLQGLQSLTYLELVHRNCRITTDVMRDLIQFALADHYGRQDLVGTRKGTSIMQQLLEVNNSLIQSVAIKLSEQGLVL
jgi:hypothetical protein